MLQIMLSMQAKLVDLVNLVMLIALCSFACILLLLLSFNVLSGANKFFYKLSMSVSVTNQNENLTNRFRSYRPVYTSLLQCDDFFAGESEIHS